MESVSNLFSFSSSCFLFETETGRLSLSTMSLVFKSISNVEFLLDESLRTSQSLSNDVLCKEERGDSPCNEDRGDPVCDDKCVGIFLSISFDPRVLASKSLF